MIMMVMLMVVMMIVMVAMATTTTTIYVTMRRHENINAPVFSQDETAVDVQVIH